MIPPERLRIRYNAADMIDDFRTVEMDPPNPSSAVPPELVMTFIGRRALKPWFRLNGIIPGSELSVNLIALETNEQFLLLREMDRYPDSFEDIYHVASKPPPRTDFHGDLLFDLELHSNT